MLMDGNANFIAFLMPAIKDMWEAAKLPLIALGIVVLILTILTIVRYFNYNAAQFLSKGIVYISIIIISSIGIAVTWILIEYAATH